MSVELFPLRDGRTMEYATYGTKGGEPAFYFHGLPGSHHDVERGIETLQKNDIAIIAPNRPGIGRSTLQRNRRVGDCASDIEELADALGLPYFSVIGVSGGGPYALSCARFLSERVKTSALINSMCPISVPGAMRGMRMFNRFFLEAGRLCPFVAEIGVWFLLRKFRQDIHACIADINRGVTEHDAEKLKDPAVSISLQHSLQDIATQGTKGVLSDIEALVHPWGFRLEEIPAKVHLWHSLDDTSVPPSMGRVLQKRIPENEAVFVEGGGHFLLMDIMGEVCKKIHVCLKEGTVFSNLKTALYESKLGRQKEDSVTL